MRNPDHSAGDEMTDADLEGVQTEYCKNCCEDSPEGEIDDVMYCKHCLASYVEWEKIRLDAISVHDEEWLVRNGRYTATGFYSIGGLEKVTDVEDNQRKMK